MNPDADPPTTPQRSRVFRAIAAILLVALGVLVTAWLVVYRIPNAMAVRRLENEIRQRGEPLTLVELAARYPSIPDEDNCAAAILKIWEDQYPGFHAAFHREGKLPESWRNSPKSDPAVPFLNDKINRIPRTGPLPETNRDAAEKFLKEQSEHLNALRAALLKPRSRFPVELTNGYNTTLPHLAGLKFDVASSFRLEALIAVERGDVDGAIDALENVARTGNALADEPFLLSQLVRISFYRMVLDDMERLLSQRQLTSGQLDKLDALLGQLKMSGALRTAVLGERACALNAFDLPFKPKEPLAPDGEEDPSAQRGYRGIGILGPLGLKAADRRLILETMGAALELADDDNPSATRQWNRVFRTASASANRFPPRIFSVAILPSYDGAKTRFVACEARRRAALTAIAVERYRLAHEGRLPEQLKQLTPQFLGNLLEDPFDWAQPVQLKALSTGYVVYSIGADHTDDGGRERSPKQGASLSGFDETFFVERE